MTIWGRLEELEAQVKMLQNFRESFMTCDRCNGMFHKTQIFYITTPTYDGFMKYCSAHKPPFDEIDYAGRYWKRNAGRTQVDVTGKEIS